MSHSATYGNFADPRADLVTIERLFTFSAVAGLGNIGAVPLFTLNAGPAPYGGTAGVVGCYIDTIYGFVVTNLVGTSGTVALGVTGSTSLFLGATAITQLVTTTPIWASTGSASAGGQVIAAAQRTTGISANIIATVATTNISAGAILFHCTYRPLSGSYLTYS